MFSKILIVLASATLIAAATAPAHAALTVNGGGTNGFSSNGIVPNGNTVNGLTGNGVTPNGMDPNGRSLQGTATGASLFVLDAIELPAAMR